MDISKGIVEKILLFLVFIQLMKYLLYYDYQDIGSSEMHSRLSDRLILLLVVRKSQVKITLQLLRKNNHERFPLWLLDSFSYKGIKDTFF
jgi:hypothetical protein